MSFNSQAGQVGIKTQSAPATYATPATGGIFFPVRSSGLGGSRELLVADPEIGGNRDVRGAVLGNISYSGEYDLYVRPGRSFLTLLKLVLGLTTPTGSAVPYSHAFASADVLPWFSIEEAIGSNFDVFRYTDAKMNTLHLEVGTDGFMMGTAGIVARTQSAGNTKTGSPTWDTAPFFVSHNAHVLFGGVELPVKSWSLDINNNIEDDDFRLGSMFMGDVPEKQREVTMGFTVRPQDHDLWRTAMYGSAAATTPGGLPLVDDLVFTVASYEDIPTAAPGTKYTLSITAPNAILRPFGLQPSGDDVIEHDVEAQMVRPDPGTDILTVVLVNGTATAS